MPPKRKRQSAATEAAAKAAQRRREDANAARADAVGLVEGAGPGVEVLIDAGEQASRGGASGAVERAGDGRGVEPAEARPSGCEKENLMADVSAVVGRSVRAPLTLLGGDGAAGGMKRICRLRMQRIRMNATGGRPGLWRIPLMHAYHKHVSRSRGGFDPRKTVRFL